ncbi:MAG: DNA-binding response regulator, partial [Zetaproteobacteria bacterium]|nr:DNA-binding response regulator [Flavobacteriales bacterium]
IDLILNNKSFYSETVMQVIRKQLTINITIDDIDRKLLYELSLGTRMIDLAEMLPLSLNGLEKRKQRLMDLFEVEVRNDRSLIINAREKGFI